MILLDTNILVYAHDLLFPVATMLTNEVTTIYTENVAHFERFGFLTVQNPL